MTLSLGRMRDLNWQGIRRRVAEERRSRLVAARTARDLTPPPPSAFAAFGEGSVIVPPARIILPSAIHIGSRVTIHEHAWLSVVAAVPGYTPKLTIGDGCRIGDMCHIACVGEIEIGANVLTAAGIFIADTYHRYQDPTVPVIEQPMAEPRKVTIGPGAFLGLGAVVLQGVTVGENAYVGAGAVVTKDVPPWTVVAGNPARPVRRYDPNTKQWEGVN